ncbi:hypothetical protein V6N13_109867 [Hibiscus sabdariffa]|uniref:Uncharacterized protein n=1 Tax=Hibiscus sabdariffa TaxID=183260 RepID=A0ABR2FQS6_9ROSI
MRDREQEQEQEQGDQDFKIDGSKDFNMQFPRKQSGKPARKSEESGVEQPQQQVGDGLAYDYKKCNEKSHEEFVQFIEGIVDNVRLKANFISSHWVKPGQRDRWDQGSGVTPIPVVYYESTVADAACGGSDEDALHSDAIRIGVTESKTF